MLMIVQLDKAAQKCPASWSPCCGLNVVLEHAVSWPTDHDQKGYDSADSADSIHQSPIIVEVLL